MFAGFMDESLDDPAVDPSPAESAVAGLPLEPSFLFIAKPAAALAIPELLAQTGTTGRQFAHLLIRAHQEANKNRFPDLERAAESIGRKRFPLGVEDVFDFAANLGLEIRWFDKAPFKDDSERVATSKTTIRSFFEPPNTVYSESRAREYAGAAQIRSVESHRP